jgi:hypothetical protein
MPTSDQLLSARARSSSAFSAGPVVIAGIQMHRDLLGQRLEILERVEGLDQQAWSTVLAGADTAAIGMPARSVSWDRFIPPLARSTGPKVTETMRLTPRGGSPKTCGPRGPRLWGAGRVVEPLRWVFDAPLSP